MNNKIQRKYPMDPEEQIIINNYLHKQKEKYRNDKEYREKIKRQNLERYHKYYSSKAIKQMEEDLIKLERIKINEIINDIDKILNNSDNSINNNI